MEEVPFIYELPSDRIAQRPVYPYDSAKLLVVDRSKKSLVASSFKNLPSFLKPQDLLVFNDTKVIPARLFGEKQGTGAKIEVLLLTELEAGLWRCLVKPKKRLKVGTEINFDNGKATVVNLTDSTEVELEFAVDGFDEFLNQSGVMPIPPYIRDGKADEKDFDDYQTQFAKFAGSVAAPTASLHFTQELVTSLNQAAIDFVTVTLHVGAASFLPIWDTETQKLSVPGQEYFMVSDTVAKKLLAAKHTGRRIIAVGTTVCRALESWVSLDYPCDQLIETDLFIKPAYQFNLTNALVTNFHQPGTTHMFLIESLLGKELLRESYTFALENDFRFLSYGDGMLVV